METSAWRRHRAIGYVAVADRQAGVIFRMMCRSDAPALHQFVPLRGK